jgi:hypothetical protein
MPITPDITHETERYRSSTSRQLWLTHKRKTCACGAVITEKQLRQYGRCSKCVKQSKQAEKAA